MPPEDVNLEKVVELVSYDSTIAAQCIRMANSPLFGRQNTETIRSAILALGLKRIEAILMGCCLNRVVAPEKMDLGFSHVLASCFGLRAREQQDGEAHRIS